MEETENKISWNDSLESLVAEEAEKCAGLSWLHTECERYFSVHTNCIALPVIILSTVNGFLSGSSQTIFTNAQVSSIALGVVSLFTGVLSTLGSYFAWAKRTEAHRISAIQYQKISKFLTIELTLPKSERIAAKDILKITREQIERLMEISPAVPESIIAKYKLRFKDTNDVAHPEVIQGLKKVVINKHEDAVVEMKDEGIKINYSLTQPHSQPTQGQLAIRR
jgi:aspartate carbamoyltransferase regulatory subunit